MILSIDSTNAAILSSTQSGLGSASPLQASVESPTPVTPVLTADDPEADAAKLANALNGFWLHLKLGSDAESIASAFVSSMQTLVTQRPDLANAQFDFSQTMVQSR
ncbi:hypothetical protein [Paraburkholderia humisilvae]|uniref:hypothetical protein n=1 Tax=Paraburkholderia humisilvae TaxID=627669 RepID=UPI0015839350|nr:hypothetical protein [Paraburkholderia humisilvae]